MSNMFKHSYSIGKRIGIVLVVIAVMTLVVGNMMPKTSVFSTNFAFAQQTADPAKAATSSSTGVLDAIGGAKLPVVGHIIKIILYLQLIVLAFLIKLAAFFAGAALHFNQGILNFDPPFIITGWKVFRDVANLGFVFGIIIIAIATILRRKTYGAQSILWKLVVAALLVNFSLTIGATIIKTSDVFSNYFLDQIGGGSVGDVTMRMVNMFQLQRFYAPKDANVIGADDNFIEKIGRFLVQGVKTLTDLFLSTPSIYELVGMSIGIMLEALIFLVSVRMTLSRTNLIGHGRSSSNSVPARARAKAPASCGF